MSIHERTPRTGNSLIAPNSEARGADALFEPHRRADIAPTLQEPASLGRTPFVELLYRMRSAPGRIAIALTHRNFRFLWMGALTSSVGTWMQKVAHAWLIVTMTGSRSAVFLGLDSFLGELPILLFTAVGGVFADRRDRRHMILMSQVIQMLVAFVLAMLIYTRRIYIAQ